VQGQIRVVQYSDVVHGLRTNTSPAPGKRKRKWLWASCAALAVASALFSLPGSRELPPARAEAATRSEIVVDPEHWNRFMHFVAADLQDFWTREFAQRGKTYSAATLLLAAEPSAEQCNAKSFELGQSYCTSTRAMSFALSTYGELKGHCGDLAGAAQSYALAHVFGHHVQTLLGLDEALAKAAASGKANKYNLNARIEMQADCMAGVWAKHTAHKDLLNAKNVERVQLCLAELAPEAPDARPRTETFSHGSARQRLAWFAKGYAARSLQDCDTFGPPTL
jgi:predicted metalloprotease